VYALRLIRHSTAGRTVFVLTIDAISKIYNNSFAIGHGESAYYIVNGRISFQWIRWAGRKRFLGCCEPSNRTHQHWVDQAGKLGEGIGRRVVRQFLRND
jgi:hypothetical protein